MWLRNCWQVIGFAREIGNAPLARTVCGEEVVLFRTQSGKAAALADRCPHRFAPLSLGRVTGEQIQCGYHGMCFDAEGHCVRVPGQETVPRQAMVRSYPLVERYSFAWIWLGDAALADPAKIPDVHWCDHPAWAVADGYHHFAANYQLVNDNLLDLSHESFVHEDTIGNEAVAEAPFTVNLDGERVRMHRDMYDMEAPPFYKRTTGFTGRIDRWHTNTFSPPGLHVIENGSMPAGAKDKSAALERKVLNFITPETSHHDALFLGDRAPVQDRRSGADRLHPRRHRQDLRPGQDGAGGAAAPDRRRSRPRGVPGLDPGRRRADPGPQAAGVDAGAGGGRGAAPLASARG